VKSTQAIAAGSDVTYRRIIGLMKQTGAGLKVAASLLRLQKRGNGLVAGGVPGGTGDLEARSRRWSQNGLFDHSAHIGFPLFLPVPSWLGHAGVTAGGSFGPASGYDGEGARYSSGVQSQVPR
jgi:hypothetical protein